MSEHKGAFSVRKKHLQAVLAMLNKLAQDLKVGFAWKVVPDKDKNFPDLVEIQIEWPEGKGDPFYVGFMVGLNTMEIVYENNAAYKVTKTQKDGF